MKNILFFSENFCGEKVKGGLEVATFRIAKGLKDSGEWEVYSAYRKKSDGTEPSIYKEVIKLSTSDRAFKKDLQEFIERNRIDVVVNMSRFFRHRTIVEAVRSSSRDVKIIFMQHFAPGSEMIKPTFSSGLHLLRLNPRNPLYWLRASLYPLLRLSRIKRLPGIYKSTYKDSDKVVLLSEGYIDDYCRIAGLEEKGKFLAIPNIFEVSSDVSQHLKKEKRVLVLSRMDEIQKRISVALKIWKNIEDDPRFQDWHLNIVGSGNNDDIVKRLIKKHGFKNVTFHGWQPREEFLKRSSILMMTSKYEGLPLSVIEAQAFGCVPVAFNSYASLKDVIKQGENGVVVENFGDIEGFTKELKELMLDEALRQRLADNAALNADKFSSEKITRLWLKMLT